MSTEHNPTKAQQDPPPCHGRFHLTYDWVANNHVPCQDCGVAFGDHPEVANPTKVRTEPARFPGYRPLEVGEKIVKGDRVCGRGQIALKESHSVGAEIEEDDVGFFYRAIEPTPQAPASEGNSPYPDMNLSLAENLRAVDLESAGLAPADELLAVWRDNGECLITTRKYPDDTGVNGPQCWPKGISGNYLATHCRKPIFHRSALDIVTGPASLRASHAALLSAVTRSQAVLTKWLQAEPKVPDLTAIGDLLAILDDQSLVQVVEAAKKGAV